MFEACDLSLWQLQMSIFGWLISMKEMRREDVRFDLAKSARFVLTMRECQENECSLSNSGCLNSNAMTKVECLPYLSVYRSCHPCMPTA